MGRRGCPLKNLTEGPAGRDMFTGKSLGNKSVMVSAARAWGWIPPTTASLTQETDPRDLQIIFQLYLCLVSKSVGSVWGEWKILTTKMCLILRMTNMKTKPGRLRIKMKQKQNQFCFKVEKASSLSHQKPLSSKFDFLRIKKIVEFINSAYAQFWQKWDSLERIRKSPFTFSFNLAAVFVA